MQIIVFINIIGRSNELKRKIIETSKSDFPLLSFSEMHMTQCVSTEYCLSVCQLKLRYLLNFNSQFFFNSSRKLSSTW